MEHFNHISLTVQYNPITKTLTGTNRCNLEAKALQTGPFV